MASNKYYKIYNIIFYKENPKVGINFFCSYLDY